MRVIAVTVDWALDDCDVTDVVRGVRSWVAAYAPDVTADVVTRPTSFRYATVRVAARSSRALHAALLTYFGGDNRAALDALRDAEVIA